MLVSKHYITNDRNCSSDLHNYINAYVNLHKYSYDNFANFEPCLTDYYLEAMHILKQSTVCYFNF